MYLCILLLMLSPWLATGAPPPVSDMYYNSATVVISCIFAEALSDWCH